MYYLSSLYGKELYMFRTDLLPIIRSINTVITAIDISHTSHVDCLLARSWPRQQTVDITIMTNINCCEYSTKNPDDGK